MKHLHPTLIQECVDRMRKISGQSKLTKRPHRRLTWTVQPYSLGGTDVHPNLTRASPGRSESIPQTASRSGQPFFIAQLSAEAPFGPPFSLKIVGTHGRPGPHLTHASFGPPDSTAQTAFQSVQPFLHGSPS